MKKTARNQHRLDSLAYGPPDASPPDGEGVSEGPGRILGAVSVVRS